jgi:hypothetical protein
MKALARLIKRQLQRGRHYAVYEDELQRIWPLNEKDREAKIAQFAKEHRFHLGFYKQGLCAIFEKEPRRAACQLFSVRLGSSVSQIKRVTHRSIRKPRNAV